MLFVALGHMVILVHMAMVAREWVGVRQEDQAVWVPTGRIGGD
jgi:hypothetical protein